MPVEETFGQALRRLRSRRGLTQPQLAALVHITGGYVSDLELGRRRPHPDLAVSLDDTLGADEQLVRLAAREAATHQVDAAATGLSVVDLSVNAEPGRPLDLDDVAELRATIDHLVALDNSRGADDLWRMAVRTYRTTERALAAGTYRPVAERDLQAVVGEMAEIAGWLLYDADRQEDARRLSQEALLAARLAGDHGMEIFVLSNLAMQAIHLRRGREALRIADAVLAEQPSGRVAALFRGRRGRALALLGEEAEALRELGTARSILLDGVSASDPPWTWWIDGAELTAYEGMVYQTLGNPGRGVDLLQAAVDGVPAGKRRGRYSYLMFQLDALVDAQAWRDAQRTVDELTPYVGEVGSARMATLLRDIAGRVDRADGSPLSLREALRLLTERIGPPLGQ